MDIKFDRNELRKGIQLAQGIIAGRPAMPILSNMLLEADDDCVKATATDLDISILSKMQAEITRGGSITVPARKFADIVNALPEKDVLIKVSDNKMSIMSGACKFNIMGVPADEYPTLPKIAENDNLVIGQKTLKGMLKLTAFAMSDDTSRHVLNGILFSLKNDTLEIVATDGRRLAAVKKTIDNPGQMEKAVIIPAKTVTELGKMLTGEKDIKMLFGDSQVCFNTDNTVIFSRLVEGDFPDYKKVIPEPVTNKIEINRLEFLDVINRISLLTNQDSMAVRFDLRESDIMVSKQTAEIGSGEDRIGLLKKYEGDKFAIGFNPVYLTDVLKNLSTDRVSLELNGSDRPGVIRVNNGEYVYIVLPMQI